MNRWVSYILLLSFLRLQFVFCGCGAGYFDMPRQNPTESSCYESDHENNHHDHVCEYNDDQDNLSQDRIYSVCLCCVDCDHEGPIHRHLCLLHQPKVTSHSRLHADSIVPMRAWPIDLSNRSNQLLANSADNQRCFTSNSNLLELFGHLRI